MTGFTISPVAGDDPRIRPLLERHAAFCAETSPAESCHYLPPDALVADDLLVWAALEGETALGVGALRIASDEGEVKSMHTAPTARGKGVADAILAEILTEAAARAIPVLRLETGTQAAFAPARRLYLRHGFEERGPFGTYTEDPFSTFFERRLSQKATAQ